MSGRRGPRATYWRVSPLFWEESADWGDDAQRAGVYILTCKHRTAEGLFHMPLEYAAADLRWPLKRFGAAFDRLLDVGFVEYDPPNRVCLIVKALKWQPPDNENQAKAAVKKLEQLPRTPLLIRLRTLAGTLCPTLADAMDERFGDLIAIGFAEPIPEPIPKPFPEPIPDPHSHSSTSLETSLATPTQDGSPGVARSGGKAG